MKNSKPVLFVQKRLDFGGLAGYLVKEEDGKEFVAKVKIEGWEEVGIAEVARPSFICSSIETDEVGNNWENRYDEMKEAKEEHIANLNEVFDKVLNKVGNNGSN